VQQGHRIKSQPCWGLRQSGGCLFKQRPVWADYFR
jgi:hypothetical protein